MQGQSRSIHGTYVECTWIHQSYLLLYEYFFGTQNSVHYSSVLQVDKRISD